MVAAVMSLQTGYTVRSPARTPAPPNPVHTTPAPPNAVPQYSTVLLWFGCDGNDIIAFLKSGRPLELPLIGIQAVRILLLQLGNAALDHLSDILGNLLLVVGCHRSSNAFRNAVAFVADSYGFKWTFALTTEEVKQLFKVIDDPNYEDVFKTYLHTGARKSEILAPHFTWQDVDFRQRRVRLTGKGDKRRTVPMNDTVYAILTRRKEDENRKYPFQFDYHYVCKKFKQYVDKAELEDVTLHTLRKTYGSLLVQNGVDIFTVSKLLGHSTVKVTERHYAGLLEQDLADGIKVLDTLV